MNQSDIKSRIEALSPEKRQLLALRSGIAITNHNASKPETNLSAFVTITDEVSTVELKKFLSANLPRYMVPQNITILDELPRTPNGKIDRNALAQYEYIVSQAAETVTHHETADDVETQLVQIWQDLLGLEIIDVHDDFFELGGYSLLAIRMLARINAVFGKELPASIVMEAPTIHQLAERIRAEGDDISTQTIFTLQAEGDGAPLYCFQVHKYGVITYRYIARYTGTDRPVYGVALPQDVDEYPETIEELARIFVTSILQSQPEGPYFLSGMSIAGLIAYEVARQLLERGIEDVYVILFDTYGPDYPRMLPTGIAIRQRLALHINNLLFASDDRLQYLRELIWRNGYRMRFRAQRLINRYLHVADTTTDDDFIDTSDNRMSAEPVRLFAGQEVHGEMIELLELEEKYFETPKHFAGNFLLYRSTLQPLRASYEETLGWGKYVTGNIKVNHIRGNHSGILRYPFVESLAEKLKTDLSQLERSSS